MTANVYREWHQRKPSLQVVQSSALVVATSIPWLVLVCLVHSSSHFCMNPVVRSVGLPQEQICQLYHDNCFAGGAVKATYVPPVYEKCDLQVVGGRPKDGYGSWPMCANQVPPNSTIYSFGIGGDVSFDAVLIKRGNRIFAFDPTIEPQRARNLLAGHGAELLKSFKYMQIGLAGSNGVIAFLRPARNDRGSRTALTGTDVNISMFKDDGFMAPVLNLPTIMAAYKHDHIDVLKIDIEGVEFDICDTDEFINTLDKVGHLLFEFHSRFLSPKSKEKMPRCVERVKSKGFSVVHSTISEEFVFARLKQ